MKIRCPQCMRVSEIPHVDHGRIAVCACQATFRIDDSTVVEEFSLPDLPPPESIGRYRITQYVGRGGTNCVYKGIHPNLGVPVAVKTMLPEYAGDKPSCDQFFRAAKICAKALHPNIVEVYEVDKDAHGVPFMAMEFLSGGTLADRIMKKGNCSAKEAAEIGLAVCRALTETVRLGIVHRDIKPDNIMISADGQYKLTDLGLAKLSAPSAPGNSAHVLDENAQLKSARKTSFGTLEYMSPEQCVDTESCDIRSDIYSLGITMYQLAAGRLPFEPMTRSELRHMHLSVEPVVPSTYMPDIPMDFDYIVMHSIQKRPEDRYRTPEELLADLEAFLAGKPLPSTTGGAVPVVHAITRISVKPVKPQLRTKLLPVIAAVLVILILLCAGALLLLERRAVRQKKQEPETLPVQESVQDAFTSAGRGEMPLVRLGRPSTKALDDAGITIVEQETDTQASSYFEEAKALAAQALESGSGFGNAIENLENFTASDEYSGQAKSLIFSLKKASAAAVSELMEKLDGKAAPLIEAREWEGAVNVYRTDIGPLAPESQEARERKIEAIRGMKAAEEAQSASAPEESLP